MMNSLSFSSSSSWEEKAFAEDLNNIHARDGSLGGCVWPPRSYSCTFCMREFRSAQALGGHMNIHRRDRARLRQCLISNNNNIATDQHISDHQFDHTSNPNCCPSSSSSSKTLSRVFPLCTINDPRVSTLVSSSPHNHLSFRILLSSGLEKKQQDQGVLNGKGNEVCVETDLYMGLNNYNSVPITPSDRFCREVNNIDDETRDCAERAKLLYFFLKPCTHLQSEVNINIHEAKANIASSYISDLDLELRLGRDPKK